MRVKKSFCNSKGGNYKYIFVVSTFAMVDYCMSFINIPKGKNK